PVTSFAFVVVGVGASSFFFQAEDGIRDRTVTGVQTCALPILMSSLRAALNSFPFLGDSSSELPAASSLTGPIFPRDLTYSRHRRSEERRVGKERKLLAGRAQ